ncbi:glycoside hydrolase family 3 C-terminal domain-containing protein [Conexibacter sp. SYSU D00693]|uniref:glycoside hydrolase family 3 C-terminal domain-containing protein n=1 Tax=Conexibacter sp. SYSU D00693 TaxID=2812560 RepID=UPI00196A35FD|nr:glycoside hydrolase family 3 C-terminal domain-containing protein [Conexibacter sp. SYSU D00693]
MVVKRVMGAALLAAALLAGGATPAQAQGPGGAAGCPWMDARKTPEQRAGELIGAMTREQKLRATTYSMPPWLTWFGTAGHVDGIPSLCVPTLVLSDAGSGVAGLQVNTTTFPSGVAQAAAWDPGLAKRFGKALGEEAFAKGINVMLAPGMNIARLANGGRNFEYLGEDPVLAGQTAAAIVQGIQSNPVLAQPKHFALNEQETQRNFVNVDVDDRTLHEVYLAPFEAAVKQGGAGSIMCSYNLAFGKHVCESEKLLTGVLRDQWGFDGFVTSDWGATHSTAPSANAGMDLEMHAAPPQYFGSRLGEAIDAGQVSPERLDLMLKHIYVPMFRFGLFDKPAVGQPEAFLSKVDSPAHRALARQMSEQSAVLLKNEDDLLPFVGARQRRIAVVGSAANIVGASGASGGGGSSHGSGVPLPVSPLQGIRRAARSHGDRVTYGATASSGAAAAKRADVAVVVIADTASEGADDRTLDATPGLCVTLVCLPTGEDQNALVRAVAKANPNTVVVVNGGGPISMPWLGSVKSVLHAWFAGTENGNALAALLYGDANPSGRLPQTFPRSLGDMPTTTPEQYPGVGDQVRYTEGLEVGHRHFDAKGIEPLFPFGFGLSYTSFGYRDLRVAPAGDGAKATFTVTNTGKRAGADVAQVYVAFPKALGAPPRQLKGFRKVSLEPGESRTVTVDLDGRAFSFWDSPKQGWTRAKGCYGVHVGSSSRSLPLSGVVPIAGAACTPKALPACKAKRRATTITLRGARGARLRQVAVYVDGRRVRTQRGARRRVRLDLSRRATRTTRVRLVLTTASGRRVTERRTFRACPTTT